MTVTDGWGSRESDSQGGKGVRLKRVLIDNPCSPHSALALSSTTPRLLICPTRPLEPLPHVSYSYLGIIPPDIQASKRLNVQTSNLYPPHLPAAHPASTAINGSSLIHYRRRCSNPSSPTLHDPSSCSL